MVDLDSIRGSKLINLIILGTKGIGHAKGVKENVSWRGEEGAKLLAAAVNHKAPL